VDDGENEKIVENEKENNKEIEIEDKDEE